MIGALAIALVVIVGLVTLVVRGQHRQQAAARPTAPPPGPSTPPPPPEAKGVGAAFAPPPEGAIGDDYSAPQAKTPTDVGALTELTAAEEMPGEAPHGGARDSWELALGHAVSKDAGAKPKLFSASDNHVKKLIVAPFGLPGAIFGGTGKGKSSGYMIPFGLEWPGSMLSLAIKSEVMQATIGHCAARGPLAAFDPARTLPVELQHHALPWTPVAACETLKDTMETAKTLFRAAGGADVTNRDFWQTLGAMGLAPVMFLFAHKRGGTMRMAADAFVALNYGAEGMAAAVGTSAPPASGEQQRSAKSLDAINELIAQLKQLEKIGREHHDADLLDGATRSIKMLEALRGYPPNTQGSVLATIMQALECYMTDPRIGNVSWDDPNLIRHEMLLGLDGRPGTIYVVGPAQDQEFYRPLFTAFIAHIMHQLYREAEASTGHLNIPLLLALDEVKNLAPLPELPRYMSTGRSYHIQTVISVHCYEQLIECYGEHGAGEIWSLLEWGVLLPGVNSDMTRQHFVTISGETERERLNESGSDSTSESRSRASGEKSVSEQRGSSWAKQMERWSNVTSAELCRMQDYEAFVFVGRERSVPPLQQRRWYENNGLKQRRHTPEPESYFPMPARRPRRGSELLPRKPTIRGESVVGTTLAADPGTWVAQPAPTFSFQWQKHVLGTKEWEDIPGATSTLYAPTVSDTGCVLAVEITATNDLGADACRVLKSEPVVAVPTISGKTTLDSELTAQPGPWAGTPPPTYLYQWVRCGRHGQSAVRIPNAKAATYRPTANDVGKSLKVEVVTKSGPRSSIAISATTDVVVAAPGQGWSQSTVAAKAPSTPPPAAPGSGPPGQAPTKQPAATPAGGAAAQIEHIQPLRPTATVEPPSGPATPALPLNPEFDDVEPDPSTATASTPEQKPPRPAGIPDPFRDDAGELTSQL
jgi:Type IV secretory system Conjugative DNA transfer/Ig domain of plant-specific actin-binding protein